MSGAKPGDVFAVTCHTPPMTFAAVRDYKGWNSLDPGIGFASDSDVVDARPLALIDPDDDEAVENLAALMLKKQGVSRAPTPGEVSIAAESLREFADPKPPKPAEPTGLGAVVEDAEGYTYVRGYANGESTHPWHVIDPASNKALGWWKWDAIAAVRVLSEGVPS